MSGPSVYQLRQYRIRQGNLDRFVEEWKVGVVPLRRAHGFRVEGAWTVEEESRFLWIISYPGDFEAADRAYYASPERAGLDPDPARWVEEGHHVLMDAVEVPPG